LLIPYDKQNEVRWFFKNSMHPNIYLLYTYNCLLEYFGRVNRSPWISFSTNWLVQDSPGYGMSPILKKDFTHKFTPNQFS
jgi:hypothetical protein